MEERKQFPVKWLWGLFYVYLAGILLSALVLASTAFSFTVGSWCAWAQQAVSLGIAVALMLLPGNYRYAGMVKAAALIFGFLPLGLHMLMLMNVQTYVYWNGILGRLSTVLTLIAMSLEYITHAANSREDKTKWYILLGCSLTISLLSSVAVALLQPVLNDMAQAGEQWLIKLWNVSARSLGLGVSVIYLVLLHRVIRKQEEVD